MATSYLNTMRTPASLAYGTLLLGKDLLEVCRQTLPTYETTGHTSYSGLPSSQLQESIDRTDGKNQLVQIMDKTD
jgi:hypothetical protein